jgi:hypothetical protein
MKKRTKKTADTDLPELYTEEEIDALEAYIVKYFGDFKNVFHEIVSPDIHVDIAIIPPSADRNYYTLLTMGMGAHRMNVPEELAKYQIERAEMMICLPPDWDINNNAEDSYWPLRWLKIMARLPIEQDTWLGFGHTVPNGEGFAGNTDLCCMIVTYPTQVDDETPFCEMPDGSQVIFYQLIPIYEAEMNYKINHDAESLFEKMTDAMMQVVNIKRPSVIDE